MDGGGPDKASMMSNRLANFTRAPTTASPTMQHNAINNEVLTNISPEGCQCSVPGFCPVLGLMVGKFKHQQCQQSEFFRAAMRRQTPDWTVDQPSRGLGDTVAKAIHKVTFGKVKPCGGCKKRQKLLNRIVPFKANASQTKLDQKASPTKRAIPKDQADPGQPLSPIPYGGPVIRHLCYHVWPVNNGIWKKNLDQLLPRIDLFNGRRRMGVVTGGNTDSADAVKQYIVDRLGPDHRFEFVVKQNQPKLGEVWTFTDLLAPLATTAKNEIIVYMHAKGVRRDGHATVHEWTRAQYDVLLDDFDEVEKQLVSHVFAGSFRRRGNFFRRFCRYGWHYSGTFYAMRSHWVFQRDWKTVHKRYWGTEAWPGNIASHAESACLFGDDAGGLYKPSEWKPMAERLEAFKAARKAKPESVVVYTAIFGGYDSPKEQAAVDGVKYICFTDQPTPCHPWEMRVAPREHDDSRRENRRLKLASSLLFPDADWSIYIDGSMRLKVTPQELIEICRKADPEADTFVAVHPERKCLYQEAKTVNILRFDDPSVVRSQMERYRAEGMPENWGLFVGGLIVRRRGASTIESAWRREVENGSKRDQLSLTYVLWKNGYRIGVLPGQQADYVDVSRHQGARR